MAEPSAGRGHVRGPTLPARATTPLLELITGESLDQDYEVVARRRPAGEAGRSRRPRLVATIVVAAFGLLVTVAAVQTSAQAGVNSASREALVRQITEERSTSTGLQERIARLQATIRGLEDTLRKVNGQAGEEQSREQRLAAQTGFAPVTGPGVVITVDDSPDGEAVRDTDLQLLVDGLWNAGAEAIAINGKRLTARSALRNSGAAINLNGPPPLSPPYIVSAIGDNRTLQANLLDSTSGVAFSSLAESFGFPVTMDDVDQITLPAASPRLLRLSKAVEGSAEDNRNGPPEKEVAQ